MTLTMDLNGDGVIDQGQGLIDHGDLDVIGNTTPRYEYSFRIDLGYKDFILNVWQGIGKRDMWVLLHHTSWFNTLVDNGTNLAGDFGMKPKTIRNVIDSNYDAFILVQQIRLMAVFSIWYQMTGIC